MKNQAFFAIGTTGMIITSVLYILMAMVLVQPAHIIFYTLYTVFLSFLVIGFAQIRKMKPQPERIRP